MPERIAYVVATNSKRREDLFVMADKHSDIRQAVWTTKACNAKFSYLGSTLNVTQKRLEFILELLRCFTHGGDHVSVGSGSCTEALACLLNGQNVLSVEKDHLQYAGGIARFKAASAKYCSDPAQALDIVKSMYRFMQPKDIPARAVLLKSPSAATVEAQARVMVRPPNLSVRPHLFVVHFMLCRPAQLRRCWSLLKTKIPNDLSYTSRLPIVMSFSHHLV